MFDIDPMQAPDNDDADTEAPTEESDYDPFAAAQVEWQKISWANAHLWGRIQMIQM